MDFSFMRDEDEEMQNGGEPDRSIAGPQTTRDQVKARIAQVRTSGGEEDQAMLNEGVDPSLELARQSAQSAGIGRGLNALASASGYKADNSGYDAMEKRGTDMFGKSEQVKQAIAARKLREQGLGEQNRHNLAMEGIASRNAGMKLGKNRDIEMLPAEDAEVVKDLAKKNASKIAISNQIDAVMNRWDSLSEDQKLVQGRQLIKVLNSTEGADAVGTEEAKRLGGKLEFAMGNLFNSNPTQFGRDLPGFKEQSQGTSAAIRDAIRANEIELNNRYRKHGIARTDPEAAPQQKYAGSGPSGGLIPEAKAGSGRVTVSNGKETLSVELKDLPDALAEGFQRVQ